MPTDELKSRRHAGDFSHLPPIDLKDDRCPLPDYNKELPRIPSTSTGLLDDEADAVTLYTNISGTLTTSPIAGCRPLVLSYDVYERVHMTEAQRIAAEYRQRHCSSSDALWGAMISEPTVRDVSSNPLESQHVSSTAMQSDACINVQAIDAVIGAPLLSQHPPIGQNPSETGITHGTMNRGGGVHDDRTVSCPREDCLETLPSAVAFLSHMRVHLIHEGYVARLRRALIWVGGADHNIFAV